MLLSPQSFRLKVRCCFNHINTSGVALLQLTETRLSGARIQRLLSHAVWDEDGVRDELRTFICQTLHPPPLLPAEASPTQVFPVFVIDESGFLKRGHHSAGVGSQYCGLTHRVENCQVGVFLTYVTAAGHALIDRELYLPEDWCSDLPRRQAAHIPNHITFATKPELAKVMLQRAQAAGLPARWVVADTVYGHSSDLRQWLEEQGFAYALAVPSIEVVCVQTRAGILLSDVATIAHKALGLDQYETRSYQGWYRHITLVLLAYAFLVSICLQAPHSLPTPAEDPAARPSPPLIALTPSEVRHLLAHLFFPAPTAAPLICQWSIFRRTHQYWAGYYHRRRREKAW